MKVEILFFHNQTGHISTHSRVEAEVKDSKPIKRAISSKASVACCPPLICKKLLMPNVRKKGSLLNSVKLLLRGNKNNSKMVIMKKNKNALERIKAIPVTLSSASPVTTGIRIATAAKEATSSNIAEVMMPVAAAERCRF